jgi:hypothetical protein
MGNFREAIRTVAGVGGGMNHKSYDEIIGNAWAAE